MTNIPDSVLHDPESAIEKIGVHDHLCLIYETQEEQLLAAIPFIKIGLDRGEKCIYIADDNTAAMVIDKMKAADMDVESAVDSGKLAIINKQDAYLKQGYFDPDWMIGFLKRATDQAKAEGYTALRVTGEMTWVLGGDPGTERLMEYEAKLNYFFPDNDALAICQYNRTRFSPNIIKDVISTHPLVIYGGLVCRNFYYVPPDDFLGERQPAKEIDRLLSNIINREKAEEELRHYQERLEELVTERTAELRQMNERFSLATNAARLGVWDWNIQKNEMLWDDGMYTLFGINRADFADAHQAWLQGVHPDDRAANDELSKLAQLGKRGYDTEFRVVWPDDSIHYLKAYGQVVRGTDGKPLRMTGINFDITERRQAEEELRHYKDQLEETVQQRTVELVLARDAAEAANKSKSAFLANMSHELRTPLNAILGFSSIVHRNPQLPASQREYLDIINRSGEHLLTLINDVLDMSKIEAGRLQLEISPFDLGRMVRDVGEMMRLRAQGKGLRLLIDQSSDFPSYIKGDEARLRQIMVNLIGNAVKFTEQGGVTIRLGVKQNDQQHLLIEVEDSGPGIGPEDQQRLFKPFVQLAEGGAQKGTGLGLAITCQFVQLMGGTIVLESTLDKGSLFRVDLPLEPANAAADVLKPESGEHGKVVGIAGEQPGYRILIAEDQPENQLLLFQLMTDIGLEVKLAENGEECVKLFQSWHPDLILMDRRMPVMDGEEATRHIRQLPEGGKVKIVAVTASVFKEQQQEMLDAGMNDFVRKPYRFDEIYECLARQLGIKYLYHSSDHVEDAVPVKLTAAMLTVLPVAIREELKESLKNLDGERITAAIQQIGEIDLELGHTLTRLAEYFDYPAILKALDQTSDG